MTPARKDPPRRIGLAVILLLVAGGALAPGHAQTQNIEETLAPVTLSVKNLDVKEVLSLIAGSRDLNIVYEGDIDGSITIDLHRVPFSEALQAAVAMAGYEVVRKGNIYFVREAAEADVRIAAMNEIRTFRLDFTQPDDVMPVIDAILSPGGKVTSFKPLRALVVEDRAEVLDRAQAIVLSIDRPPRQVLIEAEILEVRLSEQARFGIDWGLVFSSGTGSGRVDAVGFSSLPGTTGEGFFVNWTDTDFNAALEAMEGVEDLNTLAAPRLLAVDGQEAEIIIGGQLGFSVVTTVENTVIQSVEFLDTGAQLRIRPTISADGYILMEIRPELSDGVIEQGLPSKTTTQVSSRVLVRDGQTVFIGGLIKERDEVTHSGIPLLMHLPLIGNLFGRKTHDLQKDEIVALITPHIVTLGTPVPYHGSGLLDPYGTGEEPAAPADEKDSEPAVDQGDDS